MIALLIINSLLQSSRHSRGVKETLQIRMAAIFTIFMWQQNKKEKSLRVCEFPLGPKDPTLGTAFDITGIKASFTF